MQKANLDDAAGNGAAKPRPSLVLAPPSVMLQWVRELKRVSSDLQIYLYHGDKAAAVPEEGVEFISKLDRSHSIFDGSNKRRRAVVVSTYQSFARRHGPSPQDTWRVGNGADANTRKSLMNTLDVAWPGNLRDCFDVVVADDGHKLKNENTNISRTVTWLNARFNILSTGTPTSNSIADMAGYSPLVFNDHDSWSTANLRLLGVDENVQPFALADDDSAAVLRLNRQSLDQFVLDPSVDPVVAGHRFSKIYEKCLLKRSYSSRIPFDNDQTIGESIPPAHIRVLETEFTPEGQNQYDDLYKVLRRRLMRPIHGGKVVWNMGVFRKLSLLTTWMGFEHVGDLIKASDLKASALRAYQKKLVHSWLKGIGKKVEGFEVPDADDYFGQLVCLLRGSPRLQALLPLICEEDLVRKEKSIVWCLFPAQQVFVAAALRLVGIDAHILGSHLTNAERDELIKSFTNDKDQTMVLISSFSLNSDGLNLQSQCRNCHIFDTPRSEAVREQAISRVRRLGQNRIVKVYDIRVRQSFNVRQIRNNISKRFPTMVAELDSRVFPVHLLHSESTVDLGQWIQKPDGTVHKLTSDNRDIPGAKLLSGDSVVEALLDAMQGEVVRVGHN